MLSASILGVTLTVLKIIGFILLGVIALALLIALEILFVPIRYKVKLKGEASSDKKSFSGIARASWLLHILNFSVKMEGSHMVMTFRVFGIPVKRQVKDKDLEAEQSKKHEQLEEELIEEIEKEIEFEPLSSKKVYVEQAEIIDIISDDKKTDNDILDEIIEDIEEDKLRVEEEEPVEKKNLFSRLKEKILKLIDKVKSVVLFLLSIPKKIKSIFAKIKDGIELGQEKLNSLEDFINDKENREAFELAKKELIFLIKHIKPTKIVGRINFGLDDPSWTGKILGLYYSIFPVRPEKFLLTAEFDRKVFEGKMMMRGHIRINHLLTSFFRLKKNDKISELMKKSR